MGNLSKEERARIEQYQRDRLESCLAEARGERERAELLAHATTPGTCDPEYCPWIGFRENLCIRKQTHDRNCRCPECCALDDEIED